MLASAFALALVFLVLGCGLKRRSRDDRRAAHTDDDPSGATGGDPHDDDPSGAAGATSPRSARVGAGGAGGGAGGVAAGRAGAARGYVNPACPPRTGVATACGGTVTETNKNPACDACAIQQCCAELKACTDDCICHTCNEAEDLADAKKCQGTNAAFDAAVACLTNKCATACGITKAKPNAGGGGSSSGGNPKLSCNQTRCSDGPAGNSLCRNAGCGACSFGRCLMF